MHASVSEPMPNLNGRTKRTGTPRLSPASSKSKIVAPREPGAFEKGSFGGCCFSARRAPAIDAGDEPPVKMFGMRKVS
jgi:hypothetical protein